MKKLLYLLFLALPFCGMAQTLEITATSDKTDILTGETLVYTLKYKCASTTTNCTNVTLVANVPSGILFPNQTVGLPPDILSYTLSADFKTMTFVFKEPLMAGNTGIIQLVGQGGFGLQDGSTATMTAQLLTGGSVGSTATVNTTLHSYDKFCPKIYNVGGGALDNPTKYSLLLATYTQNEYGSTGIGLVNPGPITVVQQFAPGTDIQSVIATPYDGQPLPVIPANACVIDNVNKKVTCTFPASTMQVNSAVAPAVDITVTVVYPSANFSTGNTVSDVATVTYQPVGSPTPITLTNGNTRTYTDGATYANPLTTSCTPYLTVPITLAAPSSKLKLVKGSNQTVKPGQSFKYDFEISNPGNTTLTNVVVEDLIPGQVIVNQILAPGNLTGFVGDEVIKFYIKTVSNPTYTEIPNNVIYNVPSGEIITGIKYTYDKIPSGAVHKYLGVQATLDPNSPPTSFQNCLTGTADNSGFILDATSTLCATTTVGQLDPFSTLSVSKIMTQYENSPYASFYGGPINPGTTFWNYISVDNQGGGLPLQNPVIMDLLPLGLDYNGTITYSPGTPTADVTDIIPNFNGTGRTLIRLKWTSPMPAGTSYKLNIAVKVTSLAPAGLASSYTANQKFYSPYTEINGIKNTAFFSGSSPAQCFIPQYFTKSQVAVSDIYDLNSDGSTIDTLCYSSDYVGITSSAQMSSVKWVKGQCDTDYSKYPAFGQTMPGGIANYKLIVTNTGNVPTKDIQILDILPFVGDAGVIDPNARLTQWRPNLVTPLQTPPGVTVYYSTASNPCRTDYVPAGPAGCTPANWTTVLPQDPTTIQSLKLDFGTTVLQPGDQVELTWDMRAPVTGVTTGDIAWNSFGFKASRADNNDPFLPSEPFKVGIKLKDNIPGNYGDFVWLDANKNGIQDSGELGVDGVRVELHQDNGDGINDPKTDPVIAFTSTANGGQYLFPNLAVGNYYAVFFLPAGYSTSTPNATADDKDSDGIPTICNGNRVTVVPITNIGSGETDLTWDQGIYPDKAAVGNYVWFDENQNNLQDESSANGINGVRVCLYTAAGTLVATDTTSNDIYGRPGYYLFDQLDPGSYYVQFKPTADKTYTPNSGSSGGSSSDETDSDADPATGKTATFTLAAGQIDLTWDAGLIIQTGPYKLGNYVWNDTNNNGKVDTGEAGVNNVTVNLYNDRNNDSKPQPDEFVTTTITGTVGGVDGIYVFDRLPTGNYIVQIHDANFSGVLKDYTSSTGNDPAPDPDDNVENDDNGTAVAGCGIISKPITLANAAEPLDGGYTNYTVDFGFYKCNKPDYTASVIQPTCAGGKGSILLGTGTVGDKVAFTTGDPSTIATYANATLISSLTGGLIVDNIANPAADVTYTIRVYNGEDGCFKDFTFTIKSLNCCTKPVAKATPKTQTICSGSTATAYTITPSTGVQYQWYGPLADTTSSLGTAISGQTTAAYTPTGVALTTVGTKYYAVVVNTTGDAACADTAFVQLIVNAKPTIADGSATICAGEAVDLTSKITNYNTYLSPVWTISTAGGTAVATPTSVKPTTTTTYVLVAQNAAGCKDTAQVVVTVNPKPNAGADQSLACANAATNTLTTATTLVPTPAGGTWAQIGTTPTTATISGNNVTGMTVAGTYQFVYTLNGCKDTVAVTVQPCAGCVKPDAGPDAASVCQPTSTAQLTAVTPGGTWAPIGSPANPSAAAIDANGNISGLSAAGTYRFVYSVTSGGQTCTDTAQVIVLAKPTIADGSATICAGEAVDLTSKITNYNTYLSPVWTIGTAGGTAVATPTSVKPTTTTTYVLVAQNAAGCQDTAQVVVTVNPKPNAGADQSLACANAATNTLTTATTLVPTPAGGTWAQIGTTPTTATITGNNVTGMSVAGTYQFVYTLNGCKDTVAVTVQPCAGCVKPNAGPDAASVCQPTSTAQLTAVTPGGTWAPIGSPANPSAAAIDANGNISGLNAAGTYRFVYSVTSGGQTCTDTAQVIVLAKPTIADGSATICAGEAVDLTSKITGYASLLSPVWTVSTAGGTAVATPTSVKPATTTTYVLVAQNAAGCKDTAQVVVTVNPKPNAGADQSLACANAATNTLTTATTLVPTPAGGIWTQIGTTPTTATITGNNVTGMTVAGTYQFVYTLNGCKDTVAVTVQPCAGCVKPDAGPDQALICTAGSAPSTATLTASPAGGTWAPQTGNPTNATVTNDGAVSGMTAPGTYYFIYSVTGGALICRDTVAVIVPNCNCNPPVPMLLTPSLTACIGDTFPTLKATVMGLATVEWYDQPTGGTLLFTGLNFKPSGTVPAGGKVFYAQTRSTDPTCPTATSSSRVPATINAQDCTKEVDLTLRKFINTKIAQIGDLLTYTVKVWNESNTNATGVEVTDSIATTVQFVTGSFTASRGNAVINNNVIQWVIGNIAANGDTVTLTYQVKATQPGIHFNTAEISKTKEKDIDSTPGNGKDNEDDIDRQCFTVPVKLCTGAKAEASVPAQYTNVQWFKNGGTTPIATGNVVLLSQVGTYTFTSANGICPAEGCCPIIIEAGTNCCLPELCVPFTVKKIK